MELYLIRHGATAGNIARRYIGRTDEPLCAEGRLEAEALREKLPQMDAIFVSPMRRTRESAAILFPKRELTVVPDFREIDFGRFEGKTATELADDPSYRAWVDAGCVGDIPDGESVAAFRARCADAFLDVVRRTTHVSRLAFVVHGGCIMSILAAYSEPKSAYFDHQISTGNVICCRWDGSRAVILKDNDIARIYKRML